MAAVAGVAVEVAVAAHEPPAVSAAAAGGGKDWEQHGVSSVMETCHDALARVVRVVGDQLALEGPDRLWEDEEALRMTWELPV